MTNKDISAKLIGRKITGVDLRPFDDGRGGETYRPRLTLDDGSVVAFVVEETDAPGNEYGIRPMIFNRPRPAPGKERAKGTAKR